MSFNKPIQLFKLLCYQHHPLVMLWALLWLSDDVTWSEALNWQRG